MNTGRRRCVARSERAKYKEGGELLARRSFSSIHLRTDRIHPSSLQANGGGGWIRRGRKRGGYFQPIFDRNKPERGMISIRIPFAFYLFSPISVNFDKYIDPKVSTCLRNVTRFKAFYFRRLRLSNTRKRGLVERYLFTKSASINIVRISINGRAVFHGDRIESVSRPRGRR